MTRSPKPKSPRGKTSPFKELGVETLETNNIKICNNLPANMTRWPACVKQLEYRLLHSFASLIPYTELKNRKKLWEGELPKDAVDSESVGRELWGKEKRVESAREIKRECQDNLKLGGDAFENMWSDIWARIFRDHVAISCTSFHRGIKPVRDTLFLKTTPAHLYDVEGCQLTRPKPDVTLTLRFGRDHATLVDLWQRYGLLSSPFNNVLEVCFPWGILEAKSTTRKGKPLAEWQAVNAATKCLRILENLERAPGFPRNVQKGAGETLPIPCFTSKGPKWELWICYKSGEDVSQKPTYQLDKVFKGDMNDLWSCVQLVRVVERLKEWALDIFMPRVDKYLKAWIEYAEANPPLVRPGESPTPNQCANVPTRSTASGIRSPDKLSLLRLLLSRDVDFSRDDAGDDGYSDCDSGIVGDCEDEGVWEEGACGVDRKYPLDRFPRFVLPDIDHRDTESPESGAAEEEFDDSGIFSNEEDEEDEEDKEDGGDEGGEGGKEGEEDDEGEDGEDSEESEESDGEGEDDGTFQPTSRRGEIQKSGLGTLPLRRSPRIANNPKYKSFSYRV